MNPHFLRHFIITCHRITKFTINSGSNPKIPKSLQNGLLMGFATYISYNFG
ncbi:Hypothetical protein I595_397 [Croceitalea dokdonensis DOKDO 023]|uniref:Uncharacterized protein n=1 Tax=Croceitalea dokdonensis DOKDO 023 TaxID=1300341 RepID=A0A0P7B480_9FLAO|nr:Hypothetical protein I595_397 [Croceitalea dokdonensis DOKDO 023]